MSSSSSNYQQAKSILAEAQANIEAHKKFNPDKPLRFVAMFSGGKDSLSMAHFVNKALKIPIELVYCNTGIGTTENRDYVHTIAERFDWPLHEIHPLPHETFEIYVSRFGWPKQGMHSAVMGFLKFHPLRKWYQVQKRQGDNVILMSGRRRAESRRRLKMKDMIKTVQRMDGMLLCSPIYHWSDEDVSRYVKSLKEYQQVDICPVYQTLHMSGDCLCGAFSRSDESRLISIFHKDLSDKIKALEEKYGGGWGRGISISEAIKQGKMDKYLCSECYYDNSSLTSQN